MEVQLTLAYVGLICHDLQCIVVAIFPHKKMSVYDIQMGLGYLFICKLKYNFFLTDFQLRVQFKGETIYYLVKLNVRHFWDFFL